MPFEALAETELATAPLRIGLMTPAWPGRSSANGIATAVAHLATGLEAIGHEVTILANHIDGPHDHPRVVLLPDVGLSLLERLLFRFAPDRALKRSEVKRIVMAANQAIATHRIEVIMAEETHGWAGDVRRMLPVPVIVTLHGPWWLHRTTPGKPDGRAGAWREAQEAAALREVDGIIAPSQDVRNRTETEWGLPDVPCSVIGNPVSLGDNAPVAAGMTDPHLLFVGRFDRIKGGDLVIEAFKRIAAVHPTCRLTFVGPDTGIKQPNGSELKLAKVYQALPDALQGRISILGTKSRDDILALRRQHPVTLIASRYETFGVALIEAMVAGSAVVATRVGGCSEIVRDGETGILVPPEDPDALAAACLRLLADRPLALRLGEAARADIRSRFAPEVIARQVAAFIAPICRKQR
jgi:glycosyltransferase involved in cell wall biosynthesis